jgi:hypothetical protein
MTDDDGETYHLVGLRPEDDDGVARAKELGLYIITWQETRVLRHYNK